MFIKIRHEKLTTTNVPTSLLFRSKTHEQQAASNLPSDQDLNTKMKSAIMAVACAAGAQAFVPPR